MPRTPEELRAISEDVLYELQMLFSTSNRLVHRLDRRTHHHAPVTILDRTNRTREGVQPISVGRHRADLDTTPRSPSVQPLGLS
jgi:hypothetical protein